MLMANYLASKCRQTCITITIEKQLSDIYYYLQSEISQRKEQKTTTQPLSQNFVSAI